jgi:hypothetical protein
VHLVQVHTFTGSLVAVWSLEKLDARLLRWRPSLLVGGDMIGVWGFDDVLDDLLVICFLALATGDAVVEDVLDYLRFGC